MRKLSLLLTVMFLFSASQLSAQTYEDAIKTFNEGFNLSKENDYAGAKVKFEKVLEISEAVGEKANEIKDKAASQIPVLQYKIAASTFKSQNFDMAISQFQEALDLAKKYNDTRLAGQIEANFPKFYFVKGTSHFKKAEYEKAIEAYSAATSYNFKYSKSWYQKALSYKNLDNFDDAVDSFEQALDAAEMEGDSKVLKEANEQLVSMHLLKGYGFFEKKQFDNAIDFYKKAISYNNNDVQVLYRLAEVHNAKAKFNEAINYAQKALEYDDSGKTDRAKIWFEIGLAYKALDKKVSACEAFEQASYGQFRNRSQHEIEFELKCKQLAQRQ